MAKKVPSHYCCNNIAFLQCFLPGMSEVVEMLIKECLQMEADWNWIDTVGSCC